MSKQVYIDVKPAEFDTYHPSTLRLVFIWKSRQGSLAVADIKDEKAQIEHAIKILKRELKKL